jgi:ribosomal protein S18 acetylase RimI-like enzyme
MGHDSMDVTIRKATMEDYEAVCDMMAESATLHREALPDVFQPPIGPVVSIEEVEKAISGEDEAVYVAECEGGVIGFIWTNVRHTPDTPVLMPKQYAYVVGVVVQEKFRNQGVGRSLMEHGHNWARAKGLDEIRLGVCEFNQEAIAFYEGLEYTTLRREMRRSLE